MKVKVMSRVQMGLRWNLGLGLRLGPRPDSQFELRFWVSTGDGSGLGSWWEWARIWLTQELKIRTELGVRLRS